MATETISRLFESTFHAKPDTLAPLPYSGSGRQYWRIRAGKASVIGVTHPDTRENNAFLYLSKHFSARGLPVPAILSESEDKQTYLLEDLGDTTLFSFLGQLRSKEDIPPSVEEMYYKVVSWLPAFQVSGHRQLDYSQCYPRQAFDKQSMAWDLNYFKYYFLKLAGIPFDEQYLEDDFQELIRLLSASPSDFFMYRDFQSRNVMLRDGEPFFIDYQGGRRGPLAYDLASLLYDAKADLPLAFRQDLLHHYLKKLNEFLPVDENEFIRQFYPFVYIRLMQAMGAYGFRGFYEKKTLFLQSIPFALRNLEWLLEHQPLPAGLPTLSKVMEAIAGSSFLRSKGKKPLAVTIRSFSYKRGIPADSGGHGGGFVFDCRALPNPGRLAEYQHLTGKDQAVMDYLSKEIEVNNFLFNIYNIVNQSVMNYLAREFEHLSINFGCTGGQHRSVYCAERLREELEQRYPVKVAVEHGEIQ